MLLTLFCIKKKCIQFLIIYRSKILQGMLLVLSNRNKVKTDRICIWKRLSIISYKSIKGINKAVSKWFAVNIRDIFQR